MPQFDVLPIKEAQLKSASGKRAQVLQEYVRYIERLQDGQAGRLTAGPGETLGAVRRRIGAAAKQIDKAIVIKRTGEYVFFWTDPSNGRRRGRRPRAPE